MNRRKKIVDPCVISRQSLKVYHIQIAVKNCKIVCDLEPLN